MLVGEALAERGVGELRVRDGRLAAQALERRAALAGRAGDALVEQLVHGGIDPAHEEARDRGDAVDARPGFEPAGEATDVGVHHLAVPDERKDERDVHVDARGDRLLDGAHALARRGDLHHEVRAIDGAPDAPDLADRSGRVVRERRVDLDADVAVGPFRARVDRREHVRGGAHVVDRERVDDRGGRLAAADERGERGVVVDALGDRLLEDRRVGRQAGRVAVADHRRETAGLQQITRDEVEPGRLAELRERDEGVAHDRRPPSRSRACTFASRRACRGSPV